MIPFSAKVAAARAAAGLSRRAGAGGGTSLPGKLLLGMDPDAVTRLSRRLSGGVIALSATNGKTTTAKMLASMLEPEHRLCRNSAANTCARGSIRKRCTRNASGGAFRKSSRGTNSCKSGPLSFNIRQASPPATGWLTR